MFTSPEQFASATKTLFELQMMTFNALTSKAVQGVEQVVALNMATARSSVDSAMAAGQKIRDAKDAQAAMAALTSQARPDMGGAVEYQEQLKVIIDDIRKEFHDAADTHIAEAKSALSALIYDVTQNVKPGSENAVEIIKTAIDNAFKGYEQVTQATRQAVATVEEQISKATATVTPAASAASNSPSNPPSNAAD